MAATDPLYLDPPTQADLDAALNSWEAGRLRVDLDVDSPWYRVLRAESPAQALQYAAVCYPTGKRSPRLSAAPYYQYDQTRKWAQRLFDYIPDAEGFIYESHQLPGDCIVLSKMKQQECSNL
jgi:hypothetical protein